MLLALERYSAVEYRLAWLAVGVYIEVADALELQVAKVREVCRPLFNIRIFVYAQGVGIEEWTHGVDASYTILLLVLFDGVARVLACPQAAVVAYFARYAVGTAYPMQCLALDAAVGSRHAAAAVGVVCGMDACDVAILILLDALGGVFITFDDICVLQAYLLAGAQSQEFLSAILHEVLALDVEFA